MLLRCWPVLLAVACAPGAMVTRRTEPNAVRSTGELRTMHGACADTDVLSGAHGERGRAAGIFVNVRACAVTGAANTTADDGKPRLVVHFDGSTFEDANPGNWIVTVIDPSGSEVVSAHGFDRDVPNVGSCDSIGCRKYALGIVGMPAAWRVGTYRIRAVLAFDTREVASLALNLADGAITQPARPR